MMVRKKVTFKLIKGDYEIWKSLESKIDEICFSNDGTVSRRTWNSKKKTCTVEHVFQSTKAWDNSIIEITNMLSAFGIYENVIDSQDLILKELAEAAGVA